MKHAQMIFISALVFMTLTIHVTGCADDGPSCVRDDGHLNTEICTAHCSSHTNRADCEAVDWPTRPSGGWQTCVWTPFHETTIDEDGNCSYGEVRDECVFMNGGEEYEGSGLFCGEDPGDQDGFDDTISIDYFVEDERIFMNASHVSNCRSANVDVVHCVWEYHDGPQYYSLESPPECVCPCNEDFPDLLQSGF